MTREERFSPEQIITTLRQIEGLLWRREPTLAADATSGGSWSICLDRAYACMRVTRAHTPPHATAHVTP
jgi:hypothetical protein